MEPDRILRASTDLDVSRAGYGRWFGALTILEALGSPVIGSDFDPRVSFDTEA
jgi:hypothetical protein